MRSGEQLREKGTRFTASRPVGPSVDILEQEPGRPVLCLFQKAVKVDRQTLSQAVCFEKAPRREEWGSDRRGACSYRRLQSLRSNSRDQWDLLLRSHEAASSIHAGRGFPCQSLVSMRPSGTSVLIITRSGRRWIAVDNEGKSPSAKPILHTRSRFRRELYPYRCLQVVWDPAMDFP
jgi:hypothetical protein